MNYATSPAAAVGALAQQAHVPVLVRVDLGRFPPLTESTAYFVICEAPANAVKYSQADAVSVSGGRETDEREDRLVTEVVDDGIGDADPADGSALRGLADRVAATGGTLVTTSMPPTHTDEGIRAAATIRSRHPRTGVLLLSQYVETGDVMRALSRDTAGLD